jgi:hypothetical protein
VFTYIFYIQSWTKFLRMTQILVCMMAVCMMAICIYSRMLWRVIRRIANNYKVPLCHANELNPQKTFPLHISPPTKGPADIMSVILSITQVWVLTRTRLEITLSCWLSLNNRLEASKGEWCLESLFFLCQPEWSPEDSQSAVSMIPEWWWKPCKQWFEENNRMVLLIFAFLETVLRTAT